MTRQMLWMGKNEVSAVCNFKNNAQETYLFFKVDPCCLQLQK